jgi:hypothetical protein
MKKLLLAVVAVVLSLGSSLAMDPIEKGTYMLNPQLLNLGGSSNTFKFDGGPDVVLKQFGFTFMGGYAVMDNLLSTGQLGYQYMKLEDLKVQVASVGVGAKYYTPMNLFGGVNFLYNMGKADAGGDDFKVNFGELRFDVGYSLELTSAVRLEPTVSYGLKVLGGDLKIDGTEVAKLKYNGFIVNIGVSIFL